MENLTVGYRESN